MDSRCMYIIFYSVLCMCPTYFILRRTVAECLNVSLNFESSNSQHLA